MNSNDYDRALLFRAGCLLLCHPLTEQVPVSDFFCRYLILQCPYTEFVLLLRYARKHRLELCDLVGCYYDDLECKRWLALFLQTKPQSVPMDDPARILTPTGSSSMSVTQSARAMAVARLQILKTTGMPYWTRVSQSARWPNTDGSIWIVGRIRRIDAPYIRCQAENDEESWMMNRKMNPGAAELRRRGRRRAEAEKFVFAGVAANMVVVWLAAGPAHWGLRMHRSVLPTGLRA